MRLWLDEMRSAAVAKELRRLGHDVCAVQEPEQRWAWGLEDVEQLEGSCSSTRGPYHQTTSAVSSASWRRSWINILTTTPRGTIHEDNP